MLRLKAATIAIALCAAHTAAAQSFLARLQTHKPGQGIVVVTQSPEIARLVDGSVAAAPAKPAAPTAPAKPATTATHVAHQSEKSDKPEKSERAEKRDKDPDSSDTPAMKPVPRGTYKTKGYRVQAFAGGNSRNDRLAAERAGQRIRAEYPDEAVYVHFYSPRWICRVGNYRTYEEAHRMMGELHKLGYKQASIVKGKIVVSY